MYKVIKKDKVTAMKAKDKPLVDVYKVLQSMLDTDAKNKKIEPVDLKDEDIIKIMDKYYYEMKYVLDDFVKENAEKPTDNLVELIDNTSLTIEVYDKYLPTKEDIEVTKAKITAMNEEMSNIDNLKRRGGMIRGKLKKDQYTTDMYWVAKNIDSLIV